MRTEFIHLADVHLGTEQYGSGPRYNDFARAFQWTAGYAVDQRVHFVVISGDLFNKHNLDPMTLNQAVLVLEGLRRAGIPVLAIEGNHDRSHYKSFMSWVQFLSDQGLLYRLDLISDDGRQRVLPWDASAGHGSYMDLDGVRICGMRYFGAATAKLLGDVAAELETLPQAGSTYTIFLMHAGMEGQIPHMTGGLAYAQIEPLRGKVDYLGLGHIHKSYEQAGWVYNPGSLETWRVDEAPWPRGFYHVSVDTSVDPPHQARPVENPRRPFHSVWLEVDTLRTPQALCDGARRAVEQAMSTVRAQQEKARLGGLQDVRPVVHLFLKGVLPFDKQSLEPDDLKHVAQEISGALLVQIKDITRPTRYQVQHGGAERMDRAELEMSVMRQLLERDARYRSASQEWAALAVRIKELALEGTPPESIAEMLRQYRADLGESPC